MGNHTRETRAVLCRSVEGCRSIPVPYFATASTSRSQANSKMLERTSLGTRVKSNLRDNNLLDAGVSFATHHLHSARENVHAGIDRLCEPNHPGHFL